MSAQGSDVLGQPRKSADAHNEDMVHEAANKVRSFVDKGRAKAGEIGDGLQDYIQTKPLQAILIAAGAGLLVGFLFGKRR